MEYTYNNPDSVKEKILLAGIEEIQKNGIQDFSLRKVATRCGVSCAAPYKHFKDKKDLIRSIIQYINIQWHMRQSKVVKKFQGNVRKQLTQISLEYIKFLVENPHFRSIIMLKDDSMDNETIKMKSNLSDCTKNLIDEYCESVNMDYKTRKVKTFIVRSFIYGAALMFDNGELEYNECNLKFIEKSIDREFDLK